jgi:uncharacterized protein with HEPN domain
MPSDPAVAPLRDILYQIDLVGTFVAGFDGAAFHSDLRTVYAVSRCLEIISEASRGLPPPLKDRHPSIAWKRTAGAGNVYRHNDEDVAANYVWDTVQKELPPLRAIVEDELRLGDPP